MANRWETRQVDDAWEIAFVPAVPLILASFLLQRVDSLGLWWWGLVVVGAVGVAATVGVVLKGWQATRRRWAVLIPVVLSIGFAVQVAASAG